MQNTDLFPFCSENRVRSVNILGKDVPVKNYICSSDGVNYKLKPENVKLQLSVCVTSFCPCNCRFCIAGNTKSKNRIDIKKFEKTMRLLKAEDRVRGVKITGGEPFYDISLLNEVINVVFDVFGKDMEVSVSTNGIHIEKLHLIEQLERLETIHISRHHYDDAVNKAIFGSDLVPTGEKIKEAVSSISFKDIFVFNCMLLKDYINSPKEAHKFLDFSIKTGVPKVGFITCTPINDYCLEQAVDYDSVINDNDGRLLFTRCFFDYDFCSCRDGVYASENGGIIEFYGRNPKRDSRNYSRGLVYDYDNYLKDGYKGNIIF